MGDAVERTIREQWSDDWRIVRCVGEHIDQVELWAMHDVMERSRLADVWACLMAREEKGPRANRWLDEQEFRRCPVFGWMEVGPPHWFRSSRAGGDHG